jgi:hypothetical protein
MMPMRFMVQPSSVHSATIAAVSRYRHGSFWPRADQKLKPLSRRLSVVDRTAGRACLDRRLSPEHAQQYNGTVAQRNGLAAAEQCVRLRIKAERTEDVRCGHLPI